VAKRQHKPNFVPLLTEEEKELQKLHIGAQIIKLRDAAYNYAEIWEITGIVPRRQKEIIKEYRAEMRADIQDSIAEWRQTSMERLENVIKYSIEASKNAQEWRDRLMAQQNIMKAIERQEKVLGVDKPSINVDQSNHSFFLAKESDFITKLIGEPKELIDVQPLEVDAEPLQQPSVDLADQLKRDREYLNPKHGSEEQGNPPTQHDEQPSLQDRYFSSRGLQEVPHKPKWVAARPSHPATDQQPLPLMD
jgi:hypothetical protein